jgi:hypothetical protein
VLHMVKGDYAIFNMAQPDREQAVERVHQVLVGGACACTPQTAPPSCLWLGYGTVMVCMQLYATAARSLAHRVTPALCRSWRWRWRPS